MNAATKIVLGGMALMYVCQLIGWKWLPGAFAIAFVLWLLIAYAVAQ